MIIKKCLSIGLIVLMGAAVQAEPIRTALTKENRLPRLYQAELGAEFWWLEGETVDATAVVPYVRYTVLRDLVLFGTYPYLSVDPEDEFASKESGFGDATLGLEFLAYKDLFGYPWIMPHAEVSFDTGNEDEGLGSGSTDFMVGIAIGTTVNREFHFAADARYNIVDDQDNIPSIAGSLVWDLDRKFALIAEIEVSREKNRDDFNDDDRHPILFMAGMAYRATRSVHFTLHGGTSKNSDLKEAVRVKVSYTF